MSQAKIRKGNAKQRELATLLESAGFKVHVTRRTPKQVTVRGRTFWVSGNNDVFGCFDLIAVKEGNVYWLDVTEEAQRWKAKNEMGRLIGSLPGFVGMATYKNGKPGRFNLWDYTGTVFKGSITSGGLSAE